MTTSATKTRALCVATRCTSVDQFVATFHRFCGDDQTFFVATMTSRPIGLETAFSIQLADKQPVLRGMCVVLDAWDTADNRYKRPGIRLGIKRLTADSQLVFDRLRAAARAPAAIAEATPPPGPLPGPPPSLASPPRPPVFSPVTSASAGGPPLPPLVVPRRPLPSVRATTQTPAEGIRPPAFPYRRPGVETRSPVAEVKPVVAEAKPVVVEAKPVVIEAKPVAAAIKPAEVTEAKPTVVAEATSADDGARPVVDEVRASTETRPLRAPIEVTRFQVALNVDTAPPPIGAVEFKPTQVAPRARAEPRIISEPAPDDEAGVDPGTPAVIVDRPSDPDLPAATVRPRGVTGELSARFAGAPGPRAVDEASPRVVDEARPHVTQEPGGRAAAPALSAELRTPGSSLILPANPLQDLSDESLEGFVDCTLYEESGSVFHPAGDGDGDALDERADPVVAPPPPRTTSSSTLPAMPFDTPPNLTVHAQGNNESLAFAPDEPAPEAARVADLVPGAPPSFAPPGDASPGYASPGYASPAFTPPGFAPPGFAPPGFAPPGFAPPGFAPPGFASPGFASPEFAPPGPVLATPAPTMAPPFEPAVPLVLGPPTVPPPFAPAMGPASGPALGPPTVPPPFAPAPPELRMSFVGPAQPLPEPGPGDPISPPQAWFDSASASNPGSVPLSSQQVPAFPRYVTPAPVYVPPHPPAMAPGGEPAGLAAWQRWAIIAGTAVVAIVVAFSIARLVRGAGADASRGEPSPPAAARTVVAAPRPAPAPPTVTSPADRPRSPEPRATDRGVGPGPGAVAGPDTRAANGAGAPDARAAGAPGMPDTGNTDAPGTGTGTPGTGTGAPGTASAPDTGSAGPETADAAGDGDAPAHTAPPTPEDDGEAVAGGPPVVGSGPCRFTIATTPAGSVIKLDGVSLGASPLTVESTCDRHRIDVSHARYQTLTRFVTLTAEQPQALDVSLSRPIHAVTVTSFPAGVEVAINGRRAGTTPTVVQLTGFATVNLTFTKPGFQTVTRRVYSKLAQDRVYVKLTR